jgi:N4-gp56 family major capsid protein
MALDNFIPELWSAELLVNLKNQLVFGQFANRNYEGEVSRFGDTVRINSIGAVTVSDYTKNTNHAAPETLSDSQMVLTIDQGKMFNFQIDDVDRAQQNPKLMSAAMREAGFALANTTDTFLANLINAGVPAGNTLTAVDADAADGSEDERVYRALVDLSVKLDENNAPADGRWVVMKPVLIGKLRKDDRFVSFGTEANRAVAGGGTSVLGTVAGFTVYTSNKVPDNTNQQMIAGHNMAVTFADQIESLEAYRPELRFADAIKGLHVYGGKVIRPELLAKVAVDVTV